jgi:hypothetical protein
MEVDLTVVMVYEARHVEQRASDCECQRQMRWP